MHLQFVTVEGRISKHGDMCDIDRKLVDSTSIKTRAGTDDGVVFSKIKTTS